MSCCQTGANGTTSKEQGWGSIQEPILDSPEHPLQTFSVQKGFCPSYPRKFMIHYCVIEMPVFYL